MAQIIDANKNKPTKRVLSADDIKTSIAPSTSSIASHNCVNNINVIQIEGWLFKKSRVLRKWRKRWIVLCGNKIYTYKIEKGYNDNPTEIINISNIENVSLNSSSNSNNSFNIQLIDKLIFTFTSINNNKSIILKWISEISKLLSINRTMIIHKDINNNILSFGCKHFRRNCSLLCKCCNNYYFCSYCHDDIESDFINNGHELERNNIINIKCCKCGKEQLPSNKCCNTKCNLIFANYYCKYCKFWDNDDTHLLYHCNKCKVCRSGNQTNYIHCDKCGVCLDKTFYKTHKCMERSTQCDCPICGDYLHCSDQPVTFWPICGHAIHVKCMKEFLVYDTLCAICREPWMP